MELSIIGMWCISSVSINSCDIVEISINIVSTLHQSSSVSVHGIKGNRVVKHALLILDVDEEGSVIQIRVD